ncbi:hypothetical protein GIB67_015479 [Kingdonia uniflora]|uniref:Uncharacterized protein n=1 Tax=Kingdonia uniflora TaxID=39325 RepID=A0A7J7LAC6_9MAGN|nr:hypothetical protein GIB67_015479 [Kingdonia uniflora]
MVELNDFNPILDMREIQLSYISKSNTYLAVMCVRVVGPTRMCDMCDPCMQTSLCAWATHGLARPRKPAYYYKSMIRYWWLMGIPLNT